MDKFSTLVTEISLCMARVSIIQGNTPVSPCRRPERILSVHQIEKGIPPPVGTGNPYTMDANYRTGVSPTHRERGTPCACFPVCLRC